MKQFVWAVLGWFLLTAARAYAIENVVVTVTISPAVKEQIQKVSPTERKKIEAAISMVNKFAPYHFDGSAYNVGDNGDDQELKFWEKNVRPLVNRDVTKWYSNMDISQSTKESLKIDGLPNDLSASSVAVCPQIELTSITSADEHYDVIWETYYPVSFVNDRFVLKYRAKVIGTLNQLKQPPTEFFLAKDGSYVDALISVDKRNKVSQVVAQYGVTTLSTKRYLDILTRYFSGVWSGSTTADDKSKLKHLIQEIMDDEARVCGGR
jgi:hypothetical protein